MAAPSSVSPRPRYGSIDAQKGYIMFLVVLFHVSGGIDNAGMPISDGLKWMMPYSNTWMMPLMFALSGLFIESAIRRGPAEYARGRWSTLIYPYILWTFLNGALLIAGARVTNHPVDRNVIDWLFVEPVGPLWFLGALIVAQAIYGLLRFVGLKPLTIAAFAVILPFAVRVFPSTMLMRSLAAFGYFSLGQALAPVLLERLPKVKWPILVGVALAGLAADLTLLYTGWPDILFPLVAVVGSIPAVFLGSAFGDTPALAPLRAVGSASLSVFVLHTIFAAPTRIVLQKVLHIQDPTIHLIAGLFVGLVPPVLIWKWLGPRHILFRWPDPRAKAAVSTV